MLTRDAQTRADIRNRARGAYFTSHPRTEKCAELVEMFISGGSWMLDFRPPLHSTPLHSTPTPLHLLEPERELEEGGRQPIKMYQALKSAFSAAAAAAVEGCCILMRHFCQLWKDLIIGKLIIHFFSICFLLLMQCEVLAVLVITCIFSVFRVRSPV